MFIIGDEVYAGTLEVKKSKFLTIIKHVRSKEEWKNFLETYKHSKANHNCFAYKIGMQQQTAGFTDDGEPSGTAGKQIFKIIESQQLTNIGVLVIRYFGGVKLGVGPLSRAYAQAVSQTLTNIPIFELEISYAYLISFKIENTKIVDSFLKAKQVIIKKRFYNCDVHYEFESPIENLLKDGCLPLLSFTFQKIWTKK